MKNEISVFMNGWPIGSFQFQDPIDRFGNKVPLPDPQCPTTLAAIVRRADDDVQVWYGHTNMTPMPAAFSCIHHVRTPMGLCTACGDQT